MGRPSEPRCRDSHATVDPTFFTPFPSHRYRVSRSLEWSYSSFHKPATSPRSERPGAERTKGEDRDGCAARGAIGVTGWRLQMIQGWPTVGRSDRVAPRVSSVSPSSSLASVSASLHDGESPREVSVPFASVSCERSDSSQARRYLIVFLHHPASARSNRDDDSRGMRVARIGNASRDVMSDVGGVR